MSRVRRNLNNAQRLTAIPSEAAIVSIASDALDGDVATWLDVTEWNAEMPRLGLRMSDQATVEGWPEFEIEINADATDSLSLVQLYACRLAAGALTDDDFTSSGATHSATGHDFRPGDGPVNVSSSGTLPAGLSADTPYFIEVVSGNTFKLHTERAGAVKGDSETEVTTTDTGTGTHTLSAVTASENPDDNTQRFRSTLIGDLNSSVNVEVDATTSYMERVNHSPLAQYYFLTASGAGETLEIKATPIVRYEE